MSAYVYNSPKALVPAARSGHSVPVPTGPLELGFVLDASGSMASCSSTLIQSFNALLGSQREKAPAARGSVMLFSDKARLLQDGMPLAEIAPLSKETYCPSGGTALNDAIGELIGAIAARTDRVESRVIIAIMSDGEENVSRASCRFRLWRVDGGGNSHRYFAQSSLGTFVQFVAYDILCNCAIR
jgi:uncharacterized protein YegL